MSVAEAFGADIGAGRLDVPTGSGNSSGNLKLGQSAGANLLIYRLVAKKTGTLWDIWVETRARTGPNCSPQLADADSNESSSYSGGNPNNWSWTARFHPVKGDGSGACDLATDLVPAITFNPYFQRRKTSHYVTSVFTHSALKVPVGASGLAVTAGDVIYMVLAPANGAPATDYASVNFLYTIDGLEGAHGRNEVGTTAPDVFYGLDPREVMGGSDGSSQWFPGNNFNVAPFTKHLPTYLMVYSDGTAHGQPYFTAESGSNPLNAGTSYTINYKPATAGTFTHLGGAFNAADQFAVTVQKNGVTVATVTIGSPGANPGRTVVARLPSPFSYIAGDVIALTFTPNVANPFCRVVANSPFQTLLGMGSSYFTWVTGDTLRAIPLFPLPWPYPNLLTAPVPYGAPGTPAAFSATGGPGTVALAWTANAEAYFDHYNIYRDGTLLTTTTTNSFSDTTMTLNVSHSYQVSAVGIDSRESALTAAQNATATTPATIAYAGSRGTLVSSSASATQVITLTANTTVGNRLVVAGCGRQSGVVLNSVTDSRGNTWTVDKQVQDAGSNNTLGQASCKLTTALLTGDTVTLTWSGAIGPSNLAALHEFSGIAASPVDQSATAVVSTTQTSLSVGPTAATAQATELVVAAFRVSPTGTFAAAGSYTTLQALLATSGATSGDRGFGMVYQILAAAGAQTATAAQTVGSAYDATLVTYKGG